MSDLENTNAASVNKEVEKDAQAQTASVKSETTDEPPKLNHVKPPIPKLDIKKPAVPNLSDLGLSKRLDSTKEPERPLSSPLEAISVTHPKSNLSMIPPIPQPIHVKMPTPIDDKAKSDDSEKESKAEEPKKKDSNGLSYEPLPPETPEKEKQEQPETKAEPEKPATAPVPETSDDEDEDNFMKETGSDIGNCKTMAFDFSAGGELSSDDLPSVLMNNGQIGECKTMSFDFDASAVNNAVDSKSDKPLIQFDENETESDDDDMYISVNPTPDGPAIQSKSANRALIADDDDVIRSSELDAVSTYEEEGFKKSLFFERAVSRWEHASKYELPKIGDTIANYKIEALLGQGGFGAVYRVKNLTLGREEALKLILPSAKQDITNSDKRFKREVDIVSRLEHPNVVRLYSSGTLSQGVLWMTMELVKGQSLDKIISQRRLTFMEAKNIMEQILCGLQEAHALKLVHRDLKPANIIITNKSGFEGLAIILDFGLAKALGDGEDQSVQELTMVDDSKRVYGTPAYMAPEQLQAGIPGPWTDVYAAGLMFVELITGRAAVNGNTALELAFRQIHEPLILPQKWMGTAIGEIITKATAKNPGERYKDAGEFLKDLLHVNALSDPASVLQQPLPPSSRAFSAVSAPSNVTTPKKPQKTQDLDVQDAVPKKHDAHWGLLVAVAVIGWVFLIAFITLFVVLMNMGE